MTRKFSVVYVVGGAGYVGSNLVPKLLDAGYEVRVLDLFLFGDSVFAEHENHPNLVKIKGDMRDRDLLEKTIPGSDAIIHLACVSNDSSFDLNPILSKSINYECFPDIIDVAKKNKVKRFVYASSSSVYGLKDLSDVTEDVPIDPLTGYSKYKALCEDLLLEAREPGFSVLVIRPATICGYANRVRLDLIVNILTNQAVNNKKITLFGGSQMRPNIHIEDMTDLYLQSLIWEDKQIDGKVYNVGCQNHSLKDIAEIVKSVVGEDVSVVSQQTDDNRSYHICSEKIKKELGFIPKRTIKDAVVSLVQAFKASKIPNSMTDPVYYNLKVMQASDLKATL
jgi:nucleoside-diphosphate-sugar epimerase